MPRPVKWSRDLHNIRERAIRSRTETWGRSDIEQLFSVGRATAVLLLRAIGGVATVAGAHFVDRAAVIEFLDAMILAPSVEPALQERLTTANPPPRRTPLRTSLPADLRQAMLEDLPANVTLSTGRLEITAPTAIAMLESLVTLALIMQNDLERFRALIDPPAAPPIVGEAELGDLFCRLRARRGAEEAEMLQDPRPFESKLSTNRG